MALTVSMMACDLWFYSLDRHVDMEVLEWSWIVVPLNDLGDELVWWEHDILYSYVPFVMLASAITTIMLSIMIMEGKSANKAWRQKMTQASAIAALIILGSIAYQCAKWRAYGDLATWTVMVPIVLLIVPLLVLKKTRVRPDQVIIGDSGGMLPGTAIAAEVATAEESE